MDSKYEGIVKTIIQLVSSVIIVITSIFAILALKREELKFSRKFL